MEIVLLSTFMFIPKGQTDVIRIRFYLSELTGVWDVDTNNIYVDLATWKEWRDCKNDQRLQKKFFDRLRRISNTLIK